MDQLLAVDHIKGIPFCVFGDLSVRTVNQYRLPFLPEMRREELCIFCINETVSTQLT